MKKKENREAKELKIVISKDFKDAKIYAGHFSVTTLKHIHQIKIIIGDEITILKHDIGGESE